MNKLGISLEWITNKRKILISALLFLGLLSSTMIGLVLVQRSQNLQSKASTVGTLDIDTNTLKFTSPQGLYQLSYDQRLWTQTIEPDKNFGSRLVFNLNKEYGFGRLDIIEGESQLRLNELLSEIIIKSPSSPSGIEQKNFANIPSYLVTYREKIFDQNIYYYQEIIKINNNFVIFEKRSSTFRNDSDLLENLYKSVIFPKIEESTQVMGESISQDRKIVELVDLVRPSVGSIVYVYCLEIINLKPVQSGLSKKQYDFCGQSKGSGFVVSEEGFVATNGHVVNIYPEEGLVNNILYEGSKTFANDLISLLYSQSGQLASQKEVNDFYQKLSTDPQYLDRLLTEIFNLIDRGILSVKISDQKYFVNLGNEPVQIDQKKVESGDYLNSVIPSTTTFRASLVDFDYPNRYSKDVLVGKNIPTGSDVAILKIDGSQASFPALELGQVETLKEGQEVVILGYPTLVEGSNAKGAAVSYKTSTKPTVTRGIISAIKSDSSGRTVIQTDASIDHGNSGGPGFNDLGQVIGLATFTIESQSGNYNFLRDIADIQALMQKNKIENKLGELSYNWRSGLENFYQKRYNSALVDLKKAKELNPTHPTVEGFIADSEAAINGGRSLDGFLGILKGFSNSNLLLGFLGGVTVLSFLMAGSLAILPLFRKSSSVNY